jgi:Prokaryotic membrane lipoprotein lipid attachment site
VRRITAAAVVALALAGCSSAPDQAGTTTTAPATTTTLPPATGSTTTLPPRTATAVDACRLLRTRQLEPLIDDPGTGEPNEPTLPADEGGAAPVLLLASCSWPSRDDPQLVLSYLAPTTAPDGPTHLQDVLDVGTGFAEGGQVVSEEMGAEVVGLLLDGRDRVREVATVHGSALVYLVVNLPVEARDREQVEVLKELVVTALSRAPR